MKAQALSLSLVIWYIMGITVTASNIEVSGEVSGVWHVDTVRVVGDLIIEPGETLIISQGSRVEFHGHFQVIVRGTVLALGTSGAPIDFTVADSTGYSDTLTAAGGWYGFYYEHLDPDTDSSLFRYCRFRYGKAISSDDTLGLYGGVFRVMEFHKIGFSSCIFEYNQAYRWGGAIFGRYANVSITQCVFQHNRCGRQELPYGYGGAICFVHSNPVVIGNTFYHNFSTGIGGGGSFEYADPVVQFNIFQENFSGLGGGIGYLRSVPENGCSNNLFQGNEARFFGGGIACIGSHTRFVNNTVTQNTSIYGGAFYCNDSAVPSLYNCLLYDNFAAEGVEVYIWDVRSAPNFYYCNVPGDTTGFSGSGGHEGYHGEYFFNRDTLPEFTGTLPFPFQLAPSSPLKDAGTPDTVGLQVPQRDLAGSSRVYNNRIDIGAYEWNPESGIPDQSLRKNQVLLYPNPASEVVHVCFTLENEALVTISIFNMEGSLCYATTPQFFSSGSHKLSWHLRGIGQGEVTSGRYIVRFGDGESFFSRIVVIE